MNEKVSLSVVILTYNETLHLERSLTRLRGLASNVFVVDSFSTDNTLEIAQMNGAQILQHRFQNQAKQFQWALENAPINTDWVMRLDADEVIEEDLAREIAARLPLLPSNVNGVNLNRKTIFQGRFIRFGGRYPLTLLRIWRRGKARIEDRWMDEHIYLTEGEIVTFKGGFADHNLSDLTAFTEKHNRYASREALDVLNQRIGLFDGYVNLTSERTPLQVRIKRFFKEGVYNRLPYEVSAVGYFVYRYIILLGFLDGRQGLVYHALQGLWYRFLVGAKLRELEGLVRRVRDRAQLRRELERLTRMEF